MLELFEKIILAGAGLLSMTKEKAEQLVDAMIEKGQLKAKDKKAVLNRLLKGTQHFDREMDKKIRNVTVGIVKNTEKQIDALHRKVAKLSSALERTKKRNTTVLKKKTAVKKETVVKKKAVKAAPKKRTVKKNIKKNIKKK